MQTSHILCALHDDTDDYSIVGMLHDNGTYAVTIVHTFQDAVDHILTGQYNLVVADICLGQMSGIDILTIINKLHPEIRVIIIDEAMNSKHALAAFRMGAVDYLHRPLDLDFLNLRIRQELAHFQLAKQMPQISQQPTVVERHNRDTRLDPSRRAAMFVLRTPEFQQITRLIQQLMQDLQASFVGLMDSDHNLVSAVGQLANADLITLRRVLSEDYGTYRLSEVLNKQQRFTHTYFEGENSSVFITDFGDQYSVSLVIVTTTKVKPGIVWLSAKHVAAKLDKIIGTSALSCHN